MAKYLLLKHYRGAPAAVNDVPMDQWTPEEIAAHMQYMDDFADRLEGTGEFVDGQALVARGHVRPVRRRGPAAGHRRAVRGDQGPDRRLDGDRRRQPTSARSSWPASCRRRPGAGGEPIHEWLELRPFLDRAADRHRVTRPVDDDSCCGS